MVALLGGEERQLGTPPPALPTDICCKFYILLSLPWFLYPRRADVEVEPKRLPALGGRKQPVAGFPVCPKSFSAFTG